MKLGATLSLGDFTFPLAPRDYLDFAMDRSISKLDFPGGPPVYQDMGMNEKTLDFSGSIDGDDALDINDQIETLWWGGKELQLVYGDIKKTVRIQRYAPKIKRSDRVDYTMHLIVVFPEDQILNLSNVDGQSFNSGAAVTVDPNDPNAISKTFDRAYTVKAGDTLWDIAASPDVFGDGSKWETLAKGNGITDEYSLQIGQVLKLPSASNTENSLAADDSVTALALGATGQSELQTIEGGAS
jgi:LysM repeat protein